MQCVHFSFLSSWRCRVLKPTLLSRGQSVISPSLTRLRKSQQAQVLSKQQLIELRNGEGGGGDQMDTVYKVHCRASSHNDTEAEAAIDGDLHSNRRPRGATMASFVSFMYFF